MIFFFLFPLLRKKKKLIKINKLSRLFFPLEKYKLKMGMLTIFIFFNWNKQTNLHKLPFYDISIVDTHI